MGVPDPIFRDALRVLIVDDQRPYAESLRALLSEDERINVVGIALSGREAIEITSSLVPDLVLMGVNMPVMGGLEATRLIHDLGLPTRVILITGSDRPITPAAAQDAGADAFLREEQDAAELLDTFFEVASLTSVLGSPVR